MQNDNSKLKIFVAYLILGILVFLPAYLLRFSIAGIPTTALEIAIYLLASSYWLLVAKSLVKWRLPERKWLWPIGLFVVGALIGLFISPEKRIALGQFKGLIFDPIIFGLVAYSALRSKLVKADNIVYSLIAGGLWVAAAALFLPGDEEGRALSIFAYEVSPSANYLALFIVPILALAISSLKYVKLIIVTELIGGIGVLLFLFLGLVNAQSRGGLLGLGLAIFYLLYKKFTQPIRKKIAVLIAIAGLATAAYFSRPDLSANPDSGRIATSNNIRYEIWRTSAEILTQNSRNFVFGVGLGNYQRYFTELTKGRVNYPEFIAPKALTPHNVFLAMWMSGGLVMLIAFVWLLVVAFRQKDALPAQAALVALIGHGLVDTPYFKNDLSVLFWVLVVLATLGSSKK